MEIFKLLQTHSIHLKPLNKLSDGLGPEINKLALMKNFGDAYLLRHNFLYRKIRYKSFQNGLRFNIIFDDSNNRTSDHQYLILSLTQINSIIENKKIPYFNNVDCLIDLESRFPKKIVWDELSDFYKKNYLFHESCHYYFRSYFRNYTKNFQNLKLKNFYEINNFKVSNQIKIILILLEESFANTCELLALKDVDDKFHQIFYEVNSFTFLPGFRNKFNYLFQNHPFHQIFKWVLFNYLFCNFLHQNVPHNYKSILMKVCFEKDLVDSKTQHLLKDLGFEIFSLDYRFRHITTKLHFKLQGLSVENKDHHKKLLNFDFFKYFLNQEELLGFVDALLSDFFSSESDFY